MKRKLIGLLVLISINTLVSAQSSYLPLNNDYYHTIDRYEILKGNFSETFFTTVKPYTRKAVSEFIDSLNLDSSALKRTSRADKFNYNYLSNDSWEWSIGSTSDSKKTIVKRFYRKRSDLFHVHTKDFDLHVNPVIYFSGGYEKNYGALSLNSRGVEIRGMIDEKISFYTFVTDNQSIMPSYVMDLRNKQIAVPGEGFNLNFKTKGVDFLSARGYINFKASKHIAIQFGRDKNFIGNGYRSLILSDNSSAYTFLKLNTKIWKLNYTNIFTEMTAYPKRYDTLFTKKYVNYHHLSINLFKNFNVGLFEAVALRGRNKDSTKAGQLEIAYLNPIIFYRTVERELGSFDNAIAGMDFKWNLVRHISLYGQLVLDEFSLKNIKARNGWWANKQAFQLGMKYIDFFGVKNLDLQGEINYVRPYVYSHYSNFTNFSNYNQPLAHPLGANFAEMIGIARYQPLPRISLTAKLFYSKLGADTSGSNWGGDILKNYSTYEQVYGNKVAQGVRTNLMYGTLNLSYMLAHNVFIDGFATVRRYDSVIDALDQDSFIGGLSLRWNIAQRLNEF